MNPQNKSAILTFDLEFWHNSKFLKKYAKTSEGRDDFIEESVTPILESLKKNKSRATFFILGTVAEKYPSVIKKIADAGHEIACHSHSHSPINEMNPLEFANELKSSVKAIETACGQKPKGFRAPNFSIERENKWAFEILREMGFLYDSSQHPLSLKRNPPEDLATINPSLGGIYFRILPLPVYLFFIKYFSKNFPPVLYFHPWELNAQSPQIKAPWLKRKIKYWGVKKAQKKFERLLKKYNFISISDYFNENSPN